MSARLAWRVLRSGPVIAALPGFVIACWWLLHEPPAAGERLQLERDRRRVEALEEHRTARDQLAHRRGALTERIDVIRRAKAEQRDPSSWLRELFVVLPGRLRVERMDFERSRWGATLFLGGDPEGVAVESARALRASPWFAGAELSGDRAASSLELTVDFAGKPPAEGLRAPW